MQAQPLGPPSVSNSSALSPQSTGRSTVRAPAHQDRDTTETKASKGKKLAVVGRSNSMNTTTTQAPTIHTPHTGGDESDGGENQGEYFDPQLPPTPTANQFLSARGRPMSFYDMKEQQQQQKQSRPNPLGEHRSSWRSGETNYADVMAANRFSYGMPNPGRPVNPKRRSQGGMSGNMELDLSPMRLPWTMWMQTEAKNLFVAGLGEWVGTTMFLFFAFAGTQVANAGSKTPAEATTTNATAGFDPVVMLYIALSFGFSLMVNVWIFFRISGGLFNPAVTFALWAVGAVNPKRAVVLVLSQIVGSITASGLVLAIFPTALNVRTTLSDGTSLVQGLFIEALMTSELVFTILMLAKEKHKSTFIAPVGIGLALFIAELVGVYYTGGSLNPARSLGPCIVTRAFDPEHWIYWVGPFIGALLAILFYKFIKILEYEMANPGQDGDDENDPTKNPNHELREKQREMTMKILSSLGFEGAPAHAGAPGLRQTSPERQAEEGTHYASSTLDGGSDHDRAARAASGFALSTVASVSDHMHSPVHDDGTRSYTSHHRPHDVRSGRTSVHADRAS